MIATADNLDEVVADTFVRNTNYVGLFFSANGFFGFIALAFILNTDSIAISDPTIEKDVYDDINE